MADGDDVRGSLGSRQAQHDQMAKASNRVAQVSSHIDPKKSQDDNANQANQSNTGRRRRRRIDPSNDLPADWSDVLSQVKTLQTMAKNPDTTTTGYIRQKQAGKMHVRERVEALLDPGSLREIGSVAGSVTWKRDASGDKEQPESFIPSNNVQGFGLLGGREVLLTADDFSLRAGHADGAIWHKTTYVEQLAVSLKMPVVKLVDGSSGGGSVTTIKSTGYSYVPPFNGMDAITTQLNTGIPNLGAVLGPAIGIGAARVVSCHFSVMAADIGSLFNAGPAVVAGATGEEGLSLASLGGPAVHCRNGTIDNLAPNEPAAFAQLRTCLSYLPNTGTRIPPTIPASDPPTRPCPNLRSLIPRNRNRTYDPRTIITTVCDPASFFEIGALWGLPAIVGLARLAGKPVGIIASNPNHLSGALDAHGSQKLARHLKFCDVFNLPVVQFVDVPGYAVGTVAEREATMRWGVELTKAYYTTTIPIFSVIVRKTYGVAGGMMVDARNPHARVAWPSGEWGSLPLDGGIDVGHSAELRKIEREQGVEARKRRWGELEAEYRRLMNPVRTANAFGIEEIVDPSDTRAVVERWVRWVYEGELAERVGKRLAGVLQPRFG